MLNKVNKKNFLVLFKMNFVKNFNSMRIFDGSYFSDGSNFNLIWGQI
jgi:hypothetical protein